MGIHGHRIELNLHTRAEVQPFVSSACLFGRPPWNASRCTEGGHLFALNTAPGAAGGVQPTCTFQTMTEVAVVALAFAPVETDNLFLSIDANGSRHGCSSSSKTAARR